MKEIIYLMTWMNRVFGNVGDSPCRSAPFGRLT